MDTVKYNMGDTVYLKMGEEKSGMITGIVFRPHGMLYYVSWGLTETVHYDIELTTERTFMSVE